MSRHRVRLAAGCALAWALLPALLSSAPVPAKPAEKGESAAQKLRKELDVAVTIDLGNVPLPAAIEKLRDKTGVNLVLDLVAIHQYAGRSDVQVSLKVKEARLRNALQTMLAPYRLSYGIVGDRILISTADGLIRQQMRQPVSLSVEKTSFADALKKLAKETATNLVLDVRAAKEAEAPVTLQAADVPLETAVRLLAEMADLKAMQVDNVLFVTTKEKAKAIRADPDFQKHPGTGGYPQAMPGGGMMPPGGAFPPGGFPSGAFPGSAPGIPGDIPIDRVPEK